MKGLVTAQTIHRSGSQRRRTSHRRQHGSHYERANQRNRSTSQFDWSRGSSTFGSSGEHLDADTLETLENLRKSQTYNPMAASKEKRSSVSLFQKLSAEMVKRGHQSTFTRRNVRRRNRAKTIQKRRSLVQHLTFGVMGGNTTSGNTRVHPFEIEDDDSSGIFERENETDKHGPIFSFYCLMEQNEHGEVDMGIMVDFLESHGVLLADDMKYIASIVKTKRGTMASQHFSSKSEDDLGDDTETNRLPVYISYDEFEALALQLGLFPEDALNDEEKSKMKVGAGSVGDAKLTFEVDGESVLKSRSMVERERHLRGEKSPIYILRSDLPRRLAWDFFILVLLLYTITITPVRLGFDMQPEMYSFGFFIEAIIDFSFLIDIVINFLTAYEQEDGHIVTDLKKIGMHYLRGWFTLDLVSSIPFDLLSVLTSGDDSWESGTTSSVKTLKSGKIAKVLRLLKLSKLLRVARAYKVTRRLEEELDLVGRAPIRIFKLGLGTLFMSHIFACGWAGMARINGDSSYYTNSWAWQWGVTDAGFTKEYLSALYWSVTTLTTVGYGDISPVENSEMVFAAASMIIGGAFYGYIIAMLAAMMQGLDANARVYSERMESIVSYMRHRNFPRGLFRRICRYYAHYYECKTALDETSILDGLSFSLQEEVSGFLAQDIFCKSYLLYGFRESMLMSLLRSFSPIQMAIDEVVFQVGDFGAEMFFVTSGNVFAFDNMGNRMLEFGAGSVFGEFTALGLIGGRIFNVQCLDLVEMCSVTLSDIEEACYEMPTMVKKIKKRAKRSLQNLTRKLDLEDVTKAFKMLAKRKAKVIERESSVNMPSNNEASVGGGQSIFKKTLSKTGSIKEGDEAIHQWLDVGNNDETEEDEASRLEKVESEELNNARRDRTEDDRALSGVTMVSRDGQDIEKLVAVVKESMKSMESKVRGSIRVLLDKVDENKTAISKLEERLMLSMRGRVQANASPQGIKGPRLRRAGSVGYVQRKENPYARRGSLSTGTQF